MQYSKIYVVNKLQASGFAAWLFGIGFANSKILDYATVYNYLDIQKKLGYTHAEAVKLTAGKYKITRRSVYNVIADMETFIDVPPFVEKQLSKKP